LPEQKTADKLIHAACGAVMRYSSPNALIRFASDPPMVTWYKSVSRQPSLRMLWSGSPNLLVFLLGVVVLKLLRLKPPADVGISPDTEHQPMTLEDMPASARDSLRAMVAACEQHSFRLTNCAAPKLLGDFEIYLANLLHADGKTRCVANWSRSGEVVNSDGTFISRTQDGVIYGTSNQRGAQDQPPDIHVCYYPDVSIGEVYSHHEQRLQEVGEQAFVAITPAQVSEEVRALRRRVCEFLIARGLLKPMTQAEIDRLTIVMAELVPDQGDNPFRSPSTDEAAAMPRRRSVWGAMFGGACYGALLGGLAGILFRQPVPAPVNPSRAELLWFIAKFYGWFIWPALAGAFLGWLLWRRAKERAAAPIQRQFPSAAAADSE